MDPTLAAVLGVLFRWIHIVSVVVLIGGFFYAWSAQVAPAEGFRSKIYLALAGILVSGLYTLLTKHSLPPHYHMYFGIKMLLALHIFAVSFLMTLHGSDDEKKKRWARGIVMSALVVIAISAWLRWMSLSAAGAV